MRLVKGGAFRRDLYSRLNIVQIVDHIVESANPHRRYRLLPFRLVLERNGGPNVSNIAQTANSSPGYPTFILRKFWSPAPFDSAALRFFLCWIGRERRRMTVCTPTTQKQSPGTNCDAWGKPPARGSQGTDDDLRALPVAMGRSPHHRESPFVDGAARRAFDRYLRAGTSRWELEATVRGVQLFPRASRTSTSGWKSCTWGTRRVVGPFDEREDSYAVRYAAESWHRQREPRPGPKVS